MKVAFGDRIPGETPIDDASGLLIRSVKTRQELDVAEAENIRKAIVKYIVGRPTFEIAPFDFEWARGLHREMFGEVWDWAGTFRTRNLNLGVPFAQIQERLYNLLDDLNFWKEHGIGLDEQAARLHHAAVQIHPFPNGNGRWARLLTNVWLAIHDHTYIDWPETMIGESSTIRTDYIAALKAADEGDFEPLLAIHSRHRATRNVPG